MSDAVTDVPGIMYVVATASDLFSSSAFPILDRIGVRMSNKIMIIIIIEVGEQDIGFFFCARFILRHHVG